ncbi:MAG: glycoside hydrolase family 29, partial [Bacteroidota bacterium]|nr:glycoside hydrolase family 29 [Bacteroidota bacterium]
MNLRRISLLTFAFIISIVSGLKAQKVMPPKPFGPLPSEAQLKWHETEMYGFIHFTINTFTNKEWG